MMKFTKIRSVALLAVSAKVAIGFRVLVKTQAAHAGPNGRHLN